MTRIFPSVVDSAYADWFDADDAVPEGDDASYIYHIYK